MGSADDQRLQRMTIFPSSLCMLKRCIAQIDSSTSPGIRMIALQDNPAGRGNQIAPSIHSGIGNKA
jgi:hypothetical protein